MWASPSVTDRYKTKKWKEDLSYRASPLSIFCSSLSKLTILILNRDLLLLYAAGDLHDLVNALLTSLTDPNTLDRFNSRNNIFAVILLFYRIF